MSGPQDSSKWLSEHSAWIRRLEARVPLRSRHFLAQKNWHFQKNIRSCVENAVARAQFNFTLKDIYTARASIKKHESQISGPDSSNG